MSGFYLERRDPDKNMGSIKIVKQHRWFSRDQRDIFQLDVSEEADLINQK